MLNFFVRNRQMIFSIILVIVIIFIFAICYERWREIFYSFGKNLYHFINNK